ncbi:SPFH domain-containing protein [Corynebacterium matruchotii]|jgi:SPFH/band 7/PHB domain protein|uniref:SPFH/Band 7/PHB domain protein n=2 Tax=Corynebacterium matruchotii TaxID=43768 RepID=E0DHT6_9CORY|nr:SPFH domain-containing protein [Corynebacterium matruchotii]EFM47949.1 SPFH/Band 7/PHB domain protein [Corynebacterium matruchotii ATCC 14266]KAB1923280.1 SPFH domain-containing protein [Corynebacterium matruchotii]QIP46244.1 SPFH domain-containing protein [Corynebacterium matruchotii]SPW31203.1 putative membrane protease subunit [Corynebacterium matruchotii]
MSTPDITATPVGHSGTAVDITERKSWSGGGGLATIIILISIILIAPAIFLIGSTAPKLDAGTISVPLGVALILAGACCFILSLLGLTSIRIISPGETRVIQFFGRYIGTIRHTGLRAIPPLSNPTKVSIKVRNFETNTIKVNDLNGNPINIGAIVVWQVADTAKATFAVENVDDFIHSQAESALRHVATTHPYDSTDTTTIPSLSGSTDIVSAELAEEVAARATIAGLEIIETRISSLAYAPEIAQSMLQRQQAAAIVDARETIVDGAVSMVETALSQLDERDIVDLDPERRATMVSNLLVVLCSDNNAQPVINTGSLYT